MAVISSVIAYIAGLPLVALFLDASLKAVGVDPSLSTTIAWVFYIGLLIAIPVIVLLSAFGGGSSHSRI